MLSFFLNLYRFVKIIFKGIKDDDEFRFLFISIIILLTSSTIFYSRFEKWSILDSIYFSVMTMSTVGYGDFTPTTMPGKIFTIIFTFLSIGAFVAFTAKMIRLSFENRKSKGRKNDKQKVNELE